MLLPAPRSEGGDRETHADGHLPNDRVETTDAGSAPVGGTRETPGISPWGRMIGDDSMTLFGDRIKQCKCVW